MTDKKFCELYNSYTGESGMFSGIDNPKQLTVNMTGEELKEWTEFAESRKLNLFIEWLNKDCGVTMLFDKNKAVKEFLII